ncbi:MAG: two-component sensor histidine kinase, partial [Gammaproteobacteria bacterium]
MRIKAISQFLQLIILSITTLWLAVVATWIYYETTHEVKELFDAEMAQMARTIQNLVTANQA